MTLTQLFGLEDIFGLNSLSPDSEDESSRSESEVLLCSVCCTEVL